jgi:hypothetical protein
LAIGSKGNHNPEPPEASQYTGRFTESRRYGAAFPSENETVQPEAPFAKEVSLAAKQTIDIAIPVSVAANFGVTFMADPKVSATLIDAGGSVVGKNLAGSPESRGWFRSIFFERPTAASTWTLRLENTGDLEYRAVVTAWSNAAG